MIAQPVRFLTTEQVLALHEAVIAAYGGEGGIRDTGLLASAIAMPQQAFGGAYVHPDLFQMAGAYAFHICQNHPFVDGNKRTALASAVVFLFLNDKQIVMPSGHAAAMMYAVAAGTMAKVEVGLTLQAYCQS